MSFYSPNFATASSWKLSVGLITSQLRKVKFVVEDTFAFGDFDPRTSFSGMATSGYLVRKARYLKIWKFFWFSVDIGVTLAAPLSNAINIVIPYTGAGNSSDLQSGGARIDNASTAEAGTWSVAGRGDTLSFYRSGLANYTATATRIIANGFIEVT